MKKIDKKKIAKFLFLLMLLFSGIPYIVQAIDTLKSGNYILWTYDAELKSSGGIGTIIPYIKDVSCIFLFCILALKPNRNMLIVLRIFFFIIFYGIVILLISALVNQYSLNDILQCIIAGIRNYSFFMTTVLYCLKYVIYDCKILQINKIIQVLHLTLYTQFIISFLFVLFSNSFGKFGSGGYRIPGAFANSGTLGCYTIGIAIILCVLHCKYRIINKKQTILDFILLLFLVFASGMRSAQLLVIVFLLITILYMIYIKFKLNKKTLFISMMFSTILLFPLILNYIIERTNRGSLGDSAVGRIDTIKYLFNQNIFQIIFGNGIGVGTNSVISLGMENARIYDGTFNTIMGQFGLIGIFIFFVLIMKIFREIYLKTYKDKTIFFGIFLTIMIIFITGNFFEQFVMVIWIVYSVFLLMSDNVLILKNYSNDK